MTGLDPAWLAAATAVLVAAGEIGLTVASTGRRRGTAGGAHAALREQWFDAVSVHGGSEVLAVQTLRNAIMAASMLASTAALALMGTVTLLSQSMPAVPAGGTSRQAMEWLLLLLLFAALVASVVSARYFNHASFIGGMPVGSDARRRWSAVGSAYARTAGVLYGWALRQLVLIAPVLAFIVEPLGGPAVALLALVVLFGFDRFDPRAVDVPAGARQGHAGRDTESTTTRPS